MQVGRVFSEPPSPPPTDELRDALRCTAELPRGKPGGAELFPPSQRRHGQQPKQPQRQQHQPLGSPATLAPRGRSAPRGASRYLPRPLTRPRPRPSRTAEERERASSKADFARSERYSRKTRGGCGLPADEWDWESAQGSLGKPTAEAPIRREFLKTQHLDSTLQTIYLFFALELSLKGRDHSCLTATQ